MSATASKEAIIDSSLQSKAGKKKKKRVRQSIEDQLRIEVQDRYNKLVHACSKHLHKDAKIVKSFECQKIVRSIKSAKEAVGENVGLDNDGKDQSEVTKIQPRTSTRLESLELKLEQTKKLHLEALVHVGLKRLGVFSLDPRVHEEFALNFANNHLDTSTESGQKESSSPPKNEDAKAFTQYEEPFYHSLIESMLQHKRLSASLDQLNEKVTEYREWKVGREEMLRGETNPIDDAKGGKKKKKNKTIGNSAFINSTVVFAGGFNSRKRGRDFGGHEGASGLFIGSLAGIPAEEYASDGDPGIGGSDEDDFSVNLRQEEKKKNRPGQRARRAKATAIEARKSGKTWNSSSNWREKKPGRDKMKGGTDGRELSNDGGSVKPMTAQHIATMGKTWKEEGNAHPSWAAKAAEKSQGIVKFEGTKITFD